MGVPEPSLEQTLREVLSNIAEFDVQYDVDSQPPLYKASNPKTTEIPILAATYKRITPAVAESVCADLQRQAHSLGVEPLLHAAVISERTADIAAAHNVSWIDFAGNCKLVFPNHGIFMSRTGTPNPYGKTMSRNLNIFSAKSSRVVRAMLEEPSRGWQSNELARNDAVRVSPGLMSRIKKAMIDEGYAMISDHHLYLKRPKELLDDWVQHYRRSTPHQAGFYLRGDLEQVENEVAGWFTEQNLEHALSHLSAAWRLAPVIRYTTAMFLVSAEAFHDKSLDEFRNACGVQRVESGANLLLFIPEDESHFQGRSADPIMTTSPLQTYLDLMAMPGRGEEAAEAIFEKHLAESFRQAIDQLRIRS